MSSGFRQAVIALLLPTLVYASDQKREQDYSDIIEKTLVIGELVRLQAGERKFPAIYTETDRPEQLGSAIILHDRNGYPDQQVIVHSLRTLLPKRHWASLSIQAPLREEGALEAEYYDLLPEARTRIKAAVKFLRDKNEEETVVVIGYGLGALMGLYGVEEIQEDIAAMAFISLPVPDSGNPYAQTETLLKKIERPVLDIYAAGDLPAVVDSARKRRLAAKENGDYRQDRIDGADHTYRHHEGFLVQRVYGWLTKTFRQL